MPILDEDDQRRRRAMQQMANDTFGGGSGFDTGHVNRSFGVDREDATSQLQTGLSGEQEVTLTPQQSLQSNLPTGIGKSVGNDNRADENGLGDVDPNAVAPEQESVNSTLIQRAMQMMLGANPVSQAQLDATRQLGQSATAQEVGDFRARLAMGGGGGTGLGAAVSADLASRGALETERAVADEAQRGRQEQIQTILAGAGLAGQGQGMESEGLRQSLIQKMLEDLLGGENGGTMSQEAKDQFVQQYDANGDGVLDGDEMFTAAQEAQADNADPSLIGSLSTNLNPLTAAGFGMMSEATREQMTGNGYEYVNTVGTVDGDYEVWRDPATGTQYKVKVG